MHLHEIAGLGLRSRRTAKTLTGPEVKRTLFSTVRAKLQPHLLLGIGLFMLPLLGMPIPIGAQQFITEPVSDIPPGACEVAAWHGERSSWIQPACHLLRNLEIKTGVGSVVPKVGPRSTHYLLEGKLILKPLRPNGNGIGLVAGVVQHPRSSAVPEGFTDLFAYMPLSAALLGEALTLHFNVGWHYDQEEDGIGSVPSDVPEPHHNVFASAKMNVVLSERLTAVGEVYANHPIMPGYQLGLRAWLLQERLQASLSYGGHALRPEWGQGLAAGIVVSPPPLR